MPALQIAHHLKPERFTFTDDNAGGVLRRFVGAIRHSPEKFFQNFLLSSRLHPKTPNTSS